METTRKPSQMKEEGNIEFNSFGKIPFRFRIGNAEIWLEDKKSKAQWYVHNRLSG